MSNSDDSDFARAEADGVDARASVPAKKPAPSLRNAAVMLAGYQIRGLRRLFEEFERDILLPILLGEIALHNIGVLEQCFTCERFDSADDCVMNEVGDADLDRDFCPLRPCNAYSISVATGLPRETVRRKIGRLVELGWIRRRRNGHLYLTRRALTHFGTLLCTRELPEFLEIADRLRKLNGG